MKDLRAGLKEVGFPQVPVEQSVVYTIADEVIKLPESDVKGVRTLHDARLVIVLQCQADCDDTANPLVLVAPLSSKTRWKRKTDLLLTKGEAALNQDSLVLLGLIQPILKRDLRGKIGRVPAERFAKIQALMLTNFGYMARPS